MGPCGLVYERSLESLVFLLFGAARPSMVAVNASLTSEDGDESSEAEGCELGVSGREGRGRGGDLLRIAWMGSIPRSPIVSDTKPVQVQYRRTRQDTNLSIDGSRQQARWTAVYKQTGGMWLCYKREAEQDLRQRPDKYGDQLVPYPDQPRA